MPSRPILSTGIPPGGKEVPLLAWGIPMAAAFPPCAAAAIPKASQHLQHFGFPAERAFVDSTHTSAGRGKGRNQSSPPHPMLWAEDEAAAQHPRTESRFLHSAQQPGGVLQDLQHHPEIWGGGLHP